MAKSSASLLIAIMGKDLASPSFQSVAKSMKRTGDAADNFGARVGRGFASLKGMAPAAIAGAVAGLGALATAMAVDGVKSAIEEEQAVRRLAITLSNIGAQDATEQVLSFVDATQRATGVADDQLFPALQKLSQATGDVTQAQQLLQLALDISAAGYGDVETISRALSKAALGNATALNRLGVPLSANARKAGNFTVAVDELSQAFAGQASGAADTFGGRIARLSVAFDELKESFGEGFLSGLTGAEGATQDVSAAMKDLESNAESAGRMLGGVVQQAGAAAKAFDGQATETERAAGVLELAQIALTAILGPAVNPFSDLNNAAREGTEAVDDYSGATFNLGTAIRAQATAAQAAKIDVDALVDSMKDFQDQATSGVSNALTFNNALADLGDLVVSEVKPGLDATGNGFDLLTSAGRDATSTFVNVAGQAAKAAQELAGQGNYEAAAQLLYNMRTAIADTATQLGMSGIQAQMYAASLLAIPDELTSNVSLNFSINAAVAWGQGMLPGSSVSNPLQQIIEDLRAQVAASFSGGGGGGGGDSVDAAATEAQNRIKQIREQIEQTAESLREERLQMAQSIAESTESFASIVGFDQSAEARATQALQAARAAVRQAEQQVATLGARLADIGPGSDPETMEARAAATQQYAEATKALAAARGDEAKAERDQASSRLTGQNVLDDVQQRIGRVRRFLTLVRSLRAKGLAPAILNDIVNEGIDGGLEMANAINSSPDLIDDFNRAAGNLRTVSAALGAEAATDFYANEVASTNTRLLAQATRNDLPPVQVTLTLDSKVVAQQLVALDRRNGRQRRA